MSRYYGQSIYEPKRKHLQVIELRELTVMLYSHDVVGSSRFMSGRVIAVVVSATTGLHVGLPRLVMVLRTRMEYHTPESALIVDHSTVRHVLRESSGAQIRTLIV